MASTQGYRSTTLRRDTKKFPEERGSYRILEDVMVIDAGPRAVPISTCAGYPCRVVPATSRPGPPEPASSGAHVTISSTCARDSPANTKSPRVKCQNASR